MPAIVKSLECRNFRLAVQASALEQLISLSVFKPLIMSYRPQILALPAVTLIVILSLSTGAAYSVDDSVKIVAQSSFVDFQGKLNVVGTVRNTGALPIRAIVGLEVQDENGIRIEQQPTYGRIIWPLNDSPFKFVIDSGTVGHPFIADFKTVEAVHITDMIILNYTSMAAGEENAFVGTVTNNAPFDIYNLSVFASARNENATQLDSVRSNVIAVLKAGEEQPFIAITDPAVKPNIYYYSCAGLDLDAPITTVDAGGAKFIAYDLDAAAQVGAIRYENETDSIAFKIRPYSSTGGPVSLMIPQASQDQTVAVRLDGKLHESTIRDDGKTIYIDFLVPQGDHQVQIQRVTSMPEMPSAMLGLAALSAGILAAARLKAAFKIR
ncbi:MAG: hypothetical protein M3251_06050 [Thermoproteota archaeon]|nr:hypothetical protein [Thermoproteota archaeon]